MPWSFCVSFSCKKKKKLKSTCSKGKCQVDEKKPIMIVLAAGTASSSKWKAPTHIANSGSDIDETADLEESNPDPYEMENESESESSNIWRSRPNQGVKSNLKTIESSSGRGICVDGML